MVGSTPITHHYVDAQRSPEQLLTFGRHGAEAVGGLWLVDNVVPLGPGGNKSGYCKGPDTQGGESHL